MLQISNSEMKYFPFANYRFELFSQLKLFHFVCFANQGYLVVNMTSNFYKSYKEKVY